MLSVISSTRGFKDTITFLPCKGHIIHKCTQLNKDMLGFIDSTIHLL